MTARNRRTLTQDERNERAWNNPDNWVGPPWLGLYRAADDSRPMVPKRPRWLGWTLNFAHPATRWLFIVSAMLIIAGAALLQLH